MGHGHAGFSSQLLCGNYVQFWCPRVLAVKWGYYKTLTDKKHFCEVKFLHLLVLFMKLICLNKMPTTKTRPNHHLIVYSHYSSTEIITTFYYKSITVLLILL